MAYSFAIEQAIRAASILHKDQVRKGVVPYSYLTHVYAVAMLVSDYTNDEDTIVAALLHDTLEDSDYTEKELEEDFGGSVRDLVVSLTEPRQDSTGNMALIEQKKQYIKQLRNASERALVIVAADKIHNMRSIIEDYFDDHTGFLNDFGTLLNDRIIYYQELSNVLNRNLKNVILSEFNNVFTEYKNFIHDIERKQSEY